MQYKKLNKKFYNFNWNNKAIKKESIEHIYVFAYMHTVYLNNLIN